MRIRSRPTPENYTVRPIPVCGPSPPWHFSQVGLVMLLRKFAGFGFRAQFDGNPAFSAPSGEILPEPPSPKVTSNGNKQIRGEYYRLKKALSVGYPTLAGAAISIRGRSRTAELLRSIHKRIFRVSCGS